jgi:hypothetical protein
MQMGRSRSNAFIIVEVTIYILNSRLNAENSCLAYNRTSILPTNRY